MLVSRSKNETPVNLADTGYGLSQLFPIIINAVMKVNTILVQQPETLLLQDYKRSWLYFS